jgi:hypothetical protein
MEPSLVTKLKIDWTLGKIEKACTQLVTKGVSHYGLAIYIEKYLKPKEELWKFKYFTMQKYNLQRILQKKEKSFNIL